MTLPYKVRIKLLSDVCDDNSEVDYLFIFKSIKKIIKNQIFEFKDMFKDSIQDIKVGLLSIEPTFKISEKLKLFYE
jgi:hypothetical protein